MMSSFVVLIIIDLNRGLYLFDLVWFERSLLRQRWQQRNQIPACFSLILCEGSSFHSIQFEKGFSKQERIFFSKECCSKKWNKGGSKEGEESKGKRTFCQQISADIQSRDEMILWRVWQTNQIQQGSTSNRTPLLHLCSSPYNSDWRELDVNGKKITYRIQISSPLPGMVLFLSFYLPSDHRYNMFEIN